MGARAGPAGERAPSEHAAIAAARAALGKTGPCPLFELVCAFEAGQAGGWDSPAGKAFGEWFISWSSNWLDC